MAGVLQFARDRGGWTCLLVDGTARRGPRSPAVARVACTVAPGTALPVVRLTLAGNSLPEVELRVDRGAVVRQAVEHFASCGIGSVAFAMSRPGVDAAAWSAAYRETVGTADAERVHAPPASGSRRMGQRLLTEWVAQLPLHTGIIAPTDIAAIAVVAACRRAGRAVPGDAVVLGVGNDELACEATRPTISSVDLGLSRFGHEAARVLGISLDGGAAEDRTVAVPPLRVVVRASTETHASGDQLVAAALQELRRRLADPLPPTQLARLFGLSRASLERRLKAAIGQSIHGELLRLRVAEARRLLAETQMPIRDIAAAVGFGSVPYMTTVMKRHAGLTPAQFRDAARV